MINPAELTCITKEFITNEDLQEMTGKSYDVCNRIIGQVKKVSDNCGLTATITRADWILYLARNLEE